MSGQYDVEQRWRDFWSALPMNAFMGLELVDYDHEAGSVTVRMPFRRELGNMIDDSGVHGGALSALIDAMSNFVLAVKVGSDNTLTTNLRVDFLKWAGPEAVLCAAQVVQLGKRSALVDVTLTNPAGEVLALGRVGLSHRPQIHAAG